MICETQVSLCIKSALWEIFPKSAGKFPEHKLSKREFPLTMNLPEALSMSPHNDNYFIQRQRIKPL